mmetsp:Transcript_11528/g.36857  ORF Transcript_11528/g.36857 Transcript_11528/m.36857 type:complete len:288 (-) Transcript_11528:344-1207(-)
MVARGSGALLVHRLLLVLVALRRHLLDPGLEGGQVGGALANPSEHPVVERRCRGSPSRDGSSRASLCRRTSEGDLCPSRKRIAESLVVVKLFVVALPYIRHASRGCTTSEAVVAVARCRAAAHLDALLRHAARAGGRARHLLQDHAFTVCRQLNRRPTSLSGDQSILDLAVGDDFAVALPVVIDLRGRPIGLPRASAPAISATTRAIVDNRTELRAKVAIQLLAVRPLAHKGGAGHEGPCRAALVLRTLLCAIARRCRRDRGPDLTASIVPRRATLGGAADDLGGER